MAAPHTQPYQVHCQGKKHHAGATAQRMKHLRDENPPETSKKRRTETLEVPSDLQDMEVPLEDMGDVIVLTEL